MADILIRNVPASTLDALKERAKQRGRSVQAEALEALKIGAGPTGIGLVAWLKTIRPKDGDPKADADAFTAAIREARDSR